MGWSFLIPDSLLVACLLAAGLTALLLYGLWTCGTWVPRLVGWLDRTVTRLRFGSYTARFLTWTEGRFRRDRRGDPETRRGNEKGEDT